MNACWQYGRTPHLYSFLACHINLSFGPVLASSCISFWQKPAIFVSKTHWTAPTKKISSKLWVLAIHWCELTWACNRCTNRMWWNFFVEQKFQQTHHVLSHLIYIQWSLEPFNQPASKNFSEILATEQPSCWRGEQKHKPINWKDHSTNILTSVISWYFWLIKLSNIALSGAHTINMWVYSDHKTSGGREFVHQQIV